MTVLNSTQIGFSPTRIFVTRNNTVYVASSADSQVLEFTEGSVNATRKMSGGYSLFVTDNDDVYTYDGANSRVILWSVNTTSSVPVMFSSAMCGGLFIDVNNTLYCSITNMHQVVSKSLNDPSSTVSIAAGTGCVYSIPSILNGPLGIFVHLNFSLYVADSNNHRIQRFTPGQPNATTVAGNGTPGSITLLNPSGIVLDGDSYLFIVDTGHHRIVKSGSDGFRCVIGCSNAPGSSPSQLSSPQSMSFDTYGNIWVVDFGNSRVQKFILSVSSSGKYK